MASNIAKKHMEVDIEQVAIQWFSDAILEAEYNHTKEIIRIPWKNR